MKLNGKTAVITGASSGVGAATARAMAAQGARVVLIARREAKLRTLADEIEAAGGQAHHVYPADLGDAAAGTAACERIVSELGTPHVLVNNAGAVRFLFAWKTRRRTSYP